MKYLIQNEETVIIAFDNSKNELEYTIYQPMDGGVTGIPSSWQDPHTSRSDDLEDAIHMLIQELGLDPDLFEIQELED